MSTPPSTSSPSPATGTNPDSLLVSTLAQLSVQHVAPKIPEFSGSNPARWLARLDSEFAMCTPQVTDGRKKFAYATNKMAEGTLDAVEDLLLEHPRGEGIYTRFRERILATYGPSDTQLAWSFLDFPPLGDGSAMAMAASMLRLLPSDQRAGNILLREVFLQKLPTDIRNALEKLTKDDLDLVKLATRVDEIIASRATSGAGTNEVKTAGKSAATRMKSKETGAKKRQQPAGWCWYHRIHGDDADNCKNPCSFPTKQAHQIQEN